MIQADYSPLRLLRLLPDTDRDSSLRCQLIKTHIPNDRRSKPTTLHGAQEVEYQALSYTQGEPVFTKVLRLLNGTETAGDINITGVLGISGLIGHLPFLKKNGLPLVMRMRFMSKSQLRSWAIPTD